MRKFDADFQKIDPIQYMKSNLIECEKHNYTVQNSVKKKKIYIHFDIENDSLNIYEDVNDNIIDSLKSKNLIFDKILGKLIHKINMLDIKGFIFGSFSSRFWMLRLYSNNLIFKD